MSHHAIASGNAPDARTTRSWMSTIRARGRTFVAVMAALSMPVALWADEIDLTGPWQLNAACPPAITTVRGVDISEDLMTGVLSIATTDCGTLFFENGIHEIASCSSPWAAVVSGSAFSGAALVDDSHFETPFPSPFLGCVSPPLAHVAIEDSVSGTVAVDGFGSATDISGTITFTHVQGFDTGDTLCFDSGGPSGCTFLMLRSGVAPGMNVVVAPYQGASVTFAEVTGSGEVLVTPLTAPSAEVPASFQLLDVPIYFDVTTTALFAGTAAVCLPYPDQDNNGFVDGTTPPIDEGALQILHEEGGVFVDRTVSRNPVTNQICAEVSSFSQFVFGVSTGSCGDGALDVGEACDDGNATGGDCCSAVCQFESAGSPCPADGNLCTDDVCDGAGVCGVPSTPVTPCRTAGKSMLLLGHGMDPAADKLIWKWLKGAATTAGDFGSPLTTTNYTLCVYAGNSMASLGLPFGSKWQPVGTTGFKFKDPTRTPDGIFKAILKSGTAGSAKALVKGKGGNLPDTLPAQLPLPVTARLVNDANDVCFEAVYDMAAVITNGAGKFKGKTP